MSKKSKILALALCLSMLACAMPMMALANGAPSLEIGDIDVSDPADGLITVTVPYTAANIEDVTLLATIGGEEAPAPEELNNDNIAYIDQQGAETTIQGVTAFSFVVELSKFSAEASTLFIKMGGTALDTPAGAEPIIIVEATDSILIYGYVDVPAAVGATVEVDGKTVATEADGYFEIEVAETGNYDVVITAKSALTRTIPIIVDADEYEVSTNSKKIPLMFGVTRPGATIINLQDLMAIKTAFNKSEGDSLYSEALDLDSNGIINLVDLMAIKTNFNKTSDNYGLWVK